MNYRRINIDRVRGLDEVIKDIQETISDLLLLNNNDREITSVYSMTCEQYLYLEEKL